MERELVIKRKTLYRSIFD